MDVLYCPHDIAFKDLELHGIITMLGQWTYETGCQGTWCSFITPYLVLWHLTQTSLHVLNYLNAFFFGSISYDILNGSLTFNSDLYLYLMFNFFFGGGGGGGGVSTSYLNLLLVLSLVC